MSKKLREIIDAKHLEPGKFYTDNLHQIIERTASGIETPTDFYQNESGTYFTQKAWKKELKRLEKIRMKEEKATNKADVRTIPLAELKHGTSHTRKRNKKKGMYLIGAALIALSISIIVFYLYFENEETLVQEVSKEVVVIEEPEIFGNAIITGDDVRMRAGPTLQDSILSYFPKAGERVLILLNKTDSLPWAQVKRKNAMVGWVFGKYVEDSKD